MTMLPMPGGIDPDTLPRGFQVPDAQLKPRGGGMFGAGGVGRNIAGSIGDFLLQRAGAQPIFSPLMQRRQQMALEEQQRQRQLQDQMALYDYKRENPEPPNNDTANDYSFWQQHLSPEQFQQWIESKVNPPQYMNVPGVGLVQIPRGGGSQAAPTAPVGRLTPLGAGGPTSGPGGFHN